MLLSLLTGGEALFASRVEEQIQVFCSLSLSLSLSPLFFSVLPPRSFFSHLLSPLSFSLCRSRSVFLSLTLSLSYVQALSLSHTLSLTHTHTRSPSSVV